MRWAFLALFVLGCGRIGFEALDDASPSDVDATDAAVPTCPWGPWNTPLIVPELAGGMAAYDPGVRGDELELWIVRSAGDYDITSVTRASTSVGWSGEVPALSLDSVDNDTDPSPTGDGLALLFISNRTGTPRSYEARRSTIGTDFGAPALTLGLESIEVDSLDVSYNGKRAYFETNTILYETSRPALDMPFGAPTLIGPDGSFPAISRDGLELLYHRDGDIFVRTRATISDPFGAEGLSLDGMPGSGDSDLSADGTHLYRIQPPSELYLATRACL